MKRILKADILQEAKRLYKRHYHKISVRRENNQYVIELGKAFEGRTIFRGNGREVMTFFDGFEQGCQTEADSREGN